MIIPDLFILTAIGDLSEVPTTKIYKKKKKKLRGKEKLHLTSNCSFYFCIDKRPSFTFTTSAIVVCLFFQFEKGQTIVK